MQWPPEWADLATRGVSACSNSSGSSGLKAENQAANTSLYVHKERGRDSVVVYQRDPCGLSFNDTMTTVGHDHPMQIPAHLAFQRILCIVLEFLGLHLLPSGLDCAFRPWATKIPEGVSNQQRKMAE